MEVDGAPLPTQPDLVHYLLNKPVGVVSTVTDPDDRPTVTGMVPGEPRLSTRSAGSTPTPRASSS